MDHLGSKEVALRSAHEELHVLPTRSRSIDSLRSLSDRIDVLQAAEFLVEEKFIRKINYLEYIEDDETAPSMPTTTTTTTTTTAKTKTMTMIGNGESHENLKRRSSKNSLVEHELLSDDDSKDTTIKQHYVMREIGRENTRISMENGTRRNVKLVEEQMQRRELRICNAEQLLALLKPLAGEKVAAAAAATAAATTTTTAAAAAVTAPAIANDTWLLNEADCVEQQKPLPPPPPPPPTPTPPSPPPPQLEQATQRQLAPMQQAYLEPVSDISRDAIEAVSIADRRQRLEERISMERQKLLERLNSLERNSAANRRKSRREEAEEVCDDETATELPQRNRCECNNIGNRLRNMEPQSDFNDARVMPNNANKTFADRQTWTSQGEVDVYANMKAILKDTQSKFQFNPSKMLSPDEEEQLIAKMKRLRWEQNDKKSLTTDMDTLKPSHILTRDELVQQVELLKRIEDEELTKQMKLLEEIATLQQLEQDELLAGGNCMHKRPSSSVRKYH